MWHNQQGINLDGRPKSSNLKLSVFAYLESIDQPSPNFVDEHHCIPYSPFSLAENSVYGITLHFAKFSMPVRKNASHHSQLKSFFPHAINVEASIQQATCLIQIVQHHCQI
ncbi:hypothetical protein F8M41_014035 [Gigaspora margarita]|uniref:Uncharacterized protein n=1 Tax=Gigaspora margarita TaxID=4874 RepID=A0A8H4A041_GIGMA|nr:hypothetical protein F8M41_014035 [Gigaspora margarita]